MFPLGIFLGKKLVEGQNGGIYPIPLPLPIVLMIDLKNKDLHL